MLVLRSAFAQRLRDTAAALGRRARSGATPSVESRSELSARYLRELSELIDDRQISAADARTVIDDLFEPEQAGAAPRVRLSVWRAYLKDRTGHVGLHLVGEDAAASMIPPKA